MRIDVTLTPLVLFMLVAAGGIIGLVAKNRVAGSGWRQGLRTAFFLTRYDAALEYHGIGARERRGHVDELRANLTESAREVGMRKSLDRVGPPRLLAAQVAAGLSAPSWLRGGIWAVATGLVGVMALLLSSDAFFTGFQEVAAPGQSASWSALGWTVQATADAGTGATSLEMSISLLTPVLLILTPFLLGARAWRLWTSRRSGAPAHN